MTVSRSSAQCTLGDEDYLCEAADAEEAFTNVFAGVIIICHYQANGNTQAGLGGQN